MLGRLCICLFLGKNLEKDMSSNDVTGWYGGGTTVVRQGVQKLTVEGFGSIVLAQRVFITMNSFADLLHTASSNMNLSTV